MRPGRQANFRNLVAALNNISAQVNELEVLNEVGEIRVVSADNLLQGADIEALNEAVNRNEVAILNLRSVLNGNEVLNENDVLNNSLNQNNVTLNDVIAVEVLSGGDIVLYTTCAECTQVGG